MGKLARLAPECYRGRAFVHWTLTLEHRATGWLSVDFHQSWHLLRRDDCDADRAAVLPCGSGFTPDTKSVRA